MVIEPRWFSRCHPLLLEMVRGGQLLTEWLLRGVANPSMTTQPCLIECEGEAMTIQNIQNGK